MIEPEIVRIAMGAVVNAARVSRAVQRDLGRVQRITKDDKSPVTVADFAVQAIVAMALRQVDLVDPGHPGVLIAGEEHAADLKRDDHAAMRAAVLEAVRMVRPDASEQAVLEAIDACDHDATADGFWTLDPIDGTKGFLRGGQYAIALARIEHGEVISGVLGCPNLAFDRAASVEHAAGSGVICWATIGGGAWEVPEDDPGAIPIRIGPNRPSPVGPLSICRSIEASHSSEADTERLLGSLGEPIVSLRLDSQCKYAVVARGQAQAYLRLPAGTIYREKIWDHAAGALLATEAGAVVTDVAGRALDFSKGRRLEANRGVICAEATLHGRLIEAAQRLGIGRSHEAARS